MNIKFHKTDKTQSDYKDGALDVRSVDPAECFMLGEIMSTLVDAGFEVVKSSYGQGVLIRIPLTYRVTVE